MNIVDFIPRGRENAITRAELVARLNLPDRTIRNMIEIARKDGALILNDQTGAGYYVSEDVGELKRQLKQNDNRAISVLMQSVHLRRKIKELEIKASGQTMMEFEERSHG